MTDSDYDLLTPSNSVDTIKSSIGKGRGQGLLWFGMALAAAGVIAIFMSSPEESISQSPLEIDLSNAAESTKTLIGNARNAVIKSPGSASAWGRRGVLLLAHELDPDAILCSGLRSQ